MIRTYAVCEECEESEILYNKVKDVDFKYGEIVDTGKPKFEEIEGWIVKGRQNPDDPISVEFQYYCPTCKNLDGVFDSGDRVAQ